MRSLRDLKFEELSEELRSKIIDYIEFQKEQYGNSMAKFRGAYLFDDSEERAYLNDEGIVVRFIYDRREKIVKTDFFGSQEIGMLLEVQMEIPIT